MSSLDAGLGSTLQLPALALLLSLALLSSVWLPLARLLSAQLGSLWLRSGLAALRLLLLLCSLQLPPGLVLLFQHHTSVPALGGRGRGWPLAAEDQVCRADPYNTLMDREIK